MLPKCHFLSGFKPRLWGAAQQQKKDSPVDNLAVFAKSCKLLVELYIACDDIERTYRMSRDCPFTVASRWAFQCPEEGSQADHGFAHLGWTTVIPRHLSIFHDYGRYVLIIFILILRMIA